MKSPFPRSPAFRLLWIGGTVSGLGGWLMLIALPAYTYHLTGSASAAGIALAVEALPALLVGPFTGVLLDRCNITRALALANLAAAGAVALLLLADHPDRLWMIYLSALLENLAGTVLPPGTGALTRVLVGTGRELTAANALNAGTGSVLRLLAPPMGAVLMAGPGFTAVVLVNSASYLLAAVMVLEAGRKGPSHRRATAEAPAATTRRTVTSDLRSGLALVIRTPLLRGPLAGNAIFLTANAALTALLVPLVVERLHRPGHAVGYLITGLGVGFLVGSTLAVRLAARLTLRRLLIGSQLATGFGFFALVNAPNLPSAVIAAALLGMPGSILLIVTSTHLQRTAPADMQGRVGALYGAMASATAVAGGLGGPPLVAALGYPAALNTISAFALLSALSTRVLLPGPVPATTPRSEEREPGCRTLAENLAPDGPPVPRSPT